MTPQDHLIVALDFPTRDAAIELVDRLGPEVLWYKVGLELYLVEGKSIVQELVRRGKLVFLDLKLHDIPNTVAAAVRSVAGTGASLLTIHAAGGPAMLEGAVRAASTTVDLRLLAVTVLTSMDEQELRGIGISRSAGEQVSLLGKMALASGVDGLVCSPQETQAMRTAAGRDPLLVVPGIRNGGAVTDDQRRTATAGETIRRGASHLVIGRPVTQSADPLAAVRSFLEEIAAALKAVPE